MLGVLIQGLVFTSEGRARFGIARPAVMPALRLWRLAFWREGGGGGRLHLCHAYRSRGVTCTGHEYEDIQLSRTVRWGAFAVEAVPAPAGESWDLSPLRP